ncbi:MAG: mechanosensitive ion channel [Bacteroidota bacterium]|nr:mechanosensitive ion channel [Bacteroidota bacterium]MDP3145469.1 mechanosensitive ion channel [Bacteroidota bacterium]MDP3556425.1 mechanosensitive ion channel [Bacteroidota bacterium]
MNEFLSYTLFSTGGHNINVTSIVWLLGIILALFVGLKIIKKSIYSIDSFDSSKKYSVYRLIKYFLLVVVSIISLPIIGFDASVLVAGSAALLVGLGMGIQNLFNDYISGIIILVDSSVKVNDVIEVNNLVGKVLEINLRTTTVLTRDDKYIILPNSDLTRHQLINWTHNAVASRFEVSVGVDYSSDVLRVMEILTEAAIEQEGILKESKPFARFIDYGDSALLFSVFFWSEEVFRVENIKSELRINLFKKLKENNINIPFPQRVIHTKQS